MGSKNYFFSGASYLGYDRFDDRYPLPIAGNWPGLAEVGFATGLDAAVNWLNGKLFYFRGSQYLRYDIPTDKVDLGYPLPIAGNWPGFSEAGFAGGVKAAVDGLDLEHEIWPR